MERLQRNKWIIIFFMLLSAVFCATMAMGTTVASGDNERSLVIAKTNLAFEDNVYILYAVDSQGIEDKEQIKVLVWNEPQEEYLYGDEESVVLSCYYIMDIDGKNYAVFVYDRLSAKQMTDEVYAVAYYDGVYSKPIKYSILQYAHNKIQDSEDQNFKNMLTNMLAYGASAQVYYDYNTDRLATDTYYTVKVENGSLADGFTKGLYKSGTEITVIAKEPDENKVFSRWIDGNDTVLGTSATLNYVINGDITLISEYVDKEGQVVITPDDYLRFIYIEETDSYSINVKDKNNLPENIVIPSEYDGKPVTQIGYYSLTDDSSEEEMLYWGIDKNNIMNSNYAFLNCVNLKSIVIPDSITNLGYGAFFGCSSLTSITIPSSVTSIGIGAFYGCSSLTSITIPDSVISIGGGAFIGCSNLTSIVLPSSIVINHFAFTSCGLNSVYYCGNIEEWNDWDKVWIGQNNDGLQNSSVYFYSENFPENFTDNTYWHFVDDVPTVWACVHNYVFETTIQPTCTESGYTVERCTECGMRIYTETVEPLGHNYTGTVIPPTCTEQGITDLTCTLCGDNFYEEINPSHNYQYVENSFNEEQMSAEFICTACGDEIISNDIILINEHYPTNCLDNAEYTVYIAHFDDFEIQFVIYGEEGTPFHLLGNYHGVPRLFAAYETEPPEDFFNYDYEFERYEYTDALDYFFENGMICWCGEQGNCITYGVATFTCAVCEKEVFIILSGKHQVGEEIETVEPTCVDDGYTLYLCELCGDYLAFDYVPSLGGHNFEDNVCTVCGYNDCNFTLLDNDTKIE